MFERKTSVLLITLTVTIFAAIGLTLGAPALAGNSGNAGAPRMPDRLALAEDEVKQLLLLIHTNKNGKISKEEFMKFMEAEFDRLDKDNIGQLDPKELTKSQLQVTHFSQVGK